MIRVDVARRKVVNTWFSGGTSGLYGGGLWGFGGVSVEPSGAALYAATGNGLGANEHAAYFDQVVRLSPTLKLRAANYPGLVGRDVDFGATPLLYQAPGCPAQLAVMNKSGVLLVYDRAAIARARGSGCRCRPWAASSSACRPTTPRSGWSTSTTRATRGRPVQARAGGAAGGGGLRAWAWRGRRRWGRRAASGGPSLSVPPTVANGVVYAVRSADSTVYALDAATGAQLWSSGTQISGRHLRGGDGGERAAAGAGRERHALRLRAPRLSAAEGHGRPREGPYGRGRCDGRRAGAC